MQRLPFELTKNSSKYEILTPLGYQDFQGVKKLTKRGFIYFKFSDNSDLKCSLNHPFILPNGEIILSNDLDLGEPIQGKNGFIYPLSKEINYSDEIEMYDVVESKPHHLYYSNNVVSHNCDFLGSDQTLISGSKLRQLSFRRPLTSQNGLDIYQEPIVDTITDDMGLTTRVPHKYVICADTAQGKELDYSAFIIVDVTEIPYKIVGKYKNNLISTINFPDVIYDVAKRYNSAYVLIEVNDGRDVAQGLHYDLEYENILTCTTKGRAGQVLSSGYSKNPQFGLKMTTPVKKIGCANLKSLIEMDKLLLIDADIIAELATFVRQNNTFKADLETGAHDDLVMCMVIFAWLVQQKYFKELLESDIRARMRDEIESQIEHDMVPFGFILDGRQDIEPEVIAGDVWFPVETIMTWS